MMKRRTIAKIISLVAFAVIAYWSYYFFYSRIELFIEISYRYNSNKFIGWFEFIKEWYLSRGLFEAIQFIVPILQIIVLVISLISKKPIAYCFVNIIMLEFEIIYLYFCIKYGAKIIPTICEIAYTIMLTVGIIVFPKKVKNESK